MRGRHLHAVAGQPERRLDEPCPRQAAVRLPQGAEAGGDAGHRAAGSPDRVVDELLTEGHVEPDQLAARSGGHGAEAVEVPGTRCRRVPVDGVAAAEEPGHHRLGDAGGERGGDGGVRRRSAFGEDLDTCLGGGRVTGGDCRNEREGSIHAGLLP